MSISRNLWHLCVWVGLAILAAITWWATKNAWIMAIIVIAGEVAFYFVNRRGRVGRV